MKKELFKEIAYPQEVVIIRNSVGNLLNKFADLPLKEVIIAIENTDMTDVYTTFDKGMIDSTIERCKQSIKNRFEI